MNRLFDLTGKVAVVTGGAGYLGTAISEGLAEAGADVFIASRNTEQCRELAEVLKEKYTVDCSGIYLDIAEHASVRACFETIVQRTGHLDILINNACFGAKGQVEEMPEEDWQKGIDGTINGVFRCSKGVLPYMIPRHSGVLINISSMYGIVSPDPGIYGESGFDSPANYGAGKAAIIQYTRYLACHYGRFGIRANAVSPGAFPNPEAQKNGLFMERLCAKNPLGRIGKPEELKGVVIFLASQASAYLTGQNISVDGGWTAW